MRTKQTHVSVHSSKKVVISLPKSTEVTGVARKGAPCGLGAAFIRHCLACGELITIWALEVTVR